MVINQTMDQNGFCQVPGADVKEHNFLCPAIGAGVVQSTYPQDLSSSCHVTGDLTALADACYAEKDCSAFVYQPQGCCARPNPAARCCTCFSSFVWCSAAAFSTLPVCACGRHLSLCTAATLLALFSPCPGSLE